MKWDSWPGLGQVLSLPSGWDIPHQRPAPNRAENVEWRESPPRSRIGLLNIGVSPSAETSAGNRGYPASPLAEPLDSVNQPYVSLGPLPLTTRGPARQDGASGPFTVMVPTNSSPTACAT